ncbi:MAG: helix-turn-helix domain-containing protein [Nitrospirae bacterium]|nr:helix-turn-helix domain-containing protein [Nitrospirota bacterium]
MEDALKKEIGFKIKALRKRRGLTQAGLAKKVGRGLDPTYIGKIERGKQFPSIKVLKGIGDALSVPIYYFLGEEKDYRRFSRSRAELIYAIEGLDEEDRAFILEIISVLNRRRQKKEGLLKVAEGKARYGKKSR